MKSEDIKQKFFAYFQSNGHAIRPSSSLVPNNDPSLLFTNSGMVQFKDVFLGKEVRPYNCAVTAQRCIRAGGKHNDLENVGFTKRHHTFFEMLGNFSFYAYYKRGAIFYSWEFLTKVLSIPEDKLWVTVYEDDYTTAEIWLETIGINKDRFSLCGKDDNFWSMGDTGPCGPCTEIYYDYGPDVPGNPPGFGDTGDRYVELWNLVFMEYNRNSNGELEGLPKGLVDTGMGLERITAVMQGVQSNYEIDTFVDLISAAKKLTKSSEPLSNKSFHVIADHIRSCTFLLADNVFPSNKDRGYVLRRIIRRAILHGSKLGAKDTFFWRMAAHIVEGSDLFNRHLPMIEKILRKEEEQFSKTLRKGIKLLDKSIKDFDSVLSGRGVLSGERAFKLYDTYGFPLDLTEEIVRERGFSVDVERFNACMEEQRARSKGNRKTIPASEVGLSLTISDEAAKKFDDTKEKIGSIKPMLFD